MRPRLIVVAFASALAVLANATTAHATPHDEAVKKFEEGRKFRDSTETDKLQKAAEAFQASIAFETSVGAFYNLGIVNEQLGRLREAVDAYRKSRNLAHERGDAREKDAVDALNKLLEGHNYLVLLVPEDVAAAPGLRVAVDGEVVPAREFNGEVFRVGSSHDVSVIADGHKDLHIPVKNKQSISVELGPVPGATSPLPPRPPPTQPEEGGGWGWQKWTGVGLMGAGAITAGIGLVFVVGYYSEQDDLKRRFREACSATSTQKYPCNPVDGDNRAEGADLSQKAKDLDSDAVVKHAITFSIAGAAIGGGLLLFLTASSTQEKAASNAAAPPPARVRVVPRFGSVEQGVSIVGTF